MLKSLERVKASLARLLQNRKKQVAAADHWHYNANTMINGTRIQDLPESERPRERLVKHGADALSKAELLAILLRTGTKGASAIQIGGELLKQFGTLDALSRASLDDLRKVKGVGRDKAIALKSAFKLARLLVDETHGESPILDEPSRVADYLRETYRSCEVEQFKAVLLNTRRKLIRVEKICDGTLDQVIIHPREVFRAAIAANASALVLVHNHPSGDPSPSEADIKVTRNIIRAGQLLKIDVLDHIILGRRYDGRGRDYASMRELGHFYG